MTDRDYPDPDAISEKDATLDAEVGAKMRLFMDRMITTAKEEEGIDTERAIDILMCSVVQLYVEHFETTPEEMSVFCRAIAEEVLQVADGQQVVH